MTIDAHTTASVDTPQGCSRGPACDTCRLTVRDIAEIIVNGGAPPDCDP